MGQGRPPVASCAAALPAVACQLIAGYRQRRHIRQCRSSHNASHDAQPQLPTAPHGVQSKDPKGFQKPFGPNSSFPFPLCPSVLSSLGLIFPPTNAGRPLHSITPWAQTTSAAQIPGPCCRRRCAPSSARCRRTAPARQWRESDPRKSCRR